MPSPSGTNWWSTYNVSIYFLSKYLSEYPSTYLPTYLSIYLSIYLSYWNLVFQCPCHDVWELQHAAFNLWPFSIKSKNSLTLGLSRVVGWWEVVPSLLPKHCSGVSPSNFLMLMRHANILYEGSVGVAFVVKGFSAPWHVTDFFKKVIGLSQLSWKGKQGICDRV